MANFEIEAADLEHASLEELDAMLADLKMREAFGHPVTVEIAVVAPPDRLQSELRRIATVLVAATNYGPIKPLDECHGSFEITADALRAFVRAKRREAR